LYRKEESLNLSHAILQHVADVRQSFQTAVEDEQSIGAIQTDVDRLTKDYNEGKNLFISQACYACHRIAGFSRGGVGPELTQSGETYPWYLKQKISYPQFDLRNSTMPNYRIDHDELEDLVTYLLAQRGPGQKVSDLNYKTEIQEWEAGKKQSWEEPITPSQIHDLRYGMTVFATEGCAACHRLKGYESDTGFAVEKKQPSFDTLYQESQWFKKLFPEFVRGSEIVATLERDGKQIRERLTEVRQNSILEEIQKTHPGVIESLYTNFKYASRAQNHRISTLIKEEKDESKKTALKQELKNWKQLVNSVLMMYVQEYGLGRVICPRPNWAGVYRTDQWLMEHFRNPTSHVPRSIMPVFPFDDTKFYALTYTLDVLAQKNNKADKQIWKHYGFNPEMAFQKYCSQCHGEYLFGNGPVAEWIYPIPKNLRRADFLRNLTKENAIQSITHGVKGTPMPPWGELGGDKPFPNKTAILTAEEIQLLADWLFSSLPGGTIIKGSEEVPKWRYEPEDILQELQDEGGGLKGALLETEIGNYLVSLTPVVAQAPSPLKVEDVFDVVKEPLPNGGENVSYYIKKQYYTPENILRGQNLFYEHCAPCHGREADGSGLRAEAMHEAKPRMLVNLDWLQTRDDLRLLRSIKYGVPGTSMTPWGDQTSSLQRLQLVMFIRSLTQSQEEKTTFIRAIYRIFDNAEFLVERARIEEYSHLAAFQKELYQARQARENLDRGVLTKPEDKQAAIEAYQKELELIAQVESGEKSDYLYQQLRQKIKQEKELYSATGLGFLASGIDGEVLNAYLRLIELNEDRYEIKDNKLIFTDKNFNEKALHFLKDQIIKSLDTYVQEAEEQKTMIEGKLSSQERNKELSAIEAKIDALKKQKVRFLTNLSDGLRLKDEQQRMLEAINTSGGKS
jgi:mono/diheme cytochrome c family protein